MKLFSKIEQVISDAKQGKMFVLVDDENRENEGDLIVPAEKIDANKINFMAKYGRGLICLALNGKRIQELNLPLMPQQNASRRKTAFTISIEAKRGISTGISAKDRAKTIKVAINEKNGPSDIATPGHIFPLRAQEGGVLVRAGHTEAAVDIATLAKLHPSGVICEIMNDDGTMARRDDLFKFCQKHKLKIATISDLIAYKRKKEKIIEKTLEKEIKSKYGGKFKLIVYKNKLVPAEHIALVKGKINSKKSILVRVHALNFLTDILGDSSFISDDQIKQAMEMISKNKNGIVVIIREPRSWTLSQRIKSNSVGKSNKQLRDYGIGAQILIDLGVKNMILISNSKKTIIGLQGYGLKIKNTIPLK